MTTSESVQARSARRASWLLLAVTAVAAASTAGRVDPAGLTRTTASADGGRLKLEYSRFDQASAPLRLRLRVAPELGSDGLLRVRLSGEYTRAMRIDRVTPEPDAVETVADDVVFVFRSRRGNAPPLIEFEARPMDYGRKDGRVAVAGARALAFTQYIVP